MQIERVLQREIMLRLRAWPVIAIPVPNGVWIPARTEGERTLVARVVRRMKDEGMLTPGACDLVLLWATGAACIELKRPASKTLLGKTPRGHLNDNQRAFAARCADVDVRYVVVESWDELLAHLGEWGVMRAAA